MVFSHFKAINSINEIYLTKGRVCGAQIMIKKNSSQGDNASYIKRRCYIAAIRVFVLLDAKKTGIKQEKNREKNFSANLQERCFQL